MQWQHTRCRIGRVTVKDRHEGVPDIGHADEYVWSVWQRLTELLQDNMVRSVCLFGTRVDGGTFTMIGLGPENVNILIGASALMTRHLIDYQTPIESSIDDAP